MSYGHYRIAVGIASLVNGTASGLGLLTVTDMVPARMTEHALGRGLRVVVESGEGVAPVGARSYQ